MFGNKSKPSKIYAYGAHEPTTNLEVVREQLWKAHRYRNALIEVAREYLDKLRAALGELTPALAEVTAEDARLEAAIEAVRAAVKKAASARRRRESSAEAALEIEELQKQRKASWARAKELRHAAYKTQAWKDAEAEIDAWALAKRKALRAQSGVYWGTYLVIETAIDAAIDSCWRVGSRPAFRRWTGEGKLAVQIQGGAPVPEILGADNTLLQVQPRPDGVWVPGPRQQRKLGTAVAQFRVGSTKAGRAVWTEVPFTLHRPLPEGAVVKWAWLLARKVGTHMRWSLQFVLSQDSWDRGDLATSGVVGIDVGWRVMEDRRLRVAAWKGSDGAQGELCLPPGWLDEYRKTEDIQSIRDTNLDEARANMLTWLKLQKRLPERLTEARRHAHQWRAASRFASLALFWRDNRIEGDTKAFQALEAWRVRDRHLLEYEANLRDQLQARRQDIYKNFAAFMRRNYASARVENLDLRVFHVIPGAEKGPQVPGAPRTSHKEHVRDACLSQLRRLLTESLGVEEAPAHGTTMIHHACGSVEVWDRRELNHTCSRCGVTYDQDLNAARNLLDGNDGRSRAAG